MCILILKYISTSLGFLSGILLYKFGVPNMTKQDTENNIGFSTPQSEIESLKAKKKYNKYQKIGKVAFVLLSISFFIQIVILIIE